MATLITQRSQMTLQVRGLAYLHSCIPQDSHRAFSMANALARARAEYASLGPLGLVRAANGWRGS